MASAPWDTRGHTGALGRLAQGYKGSQPTGTPAAPPTPRGTRSPALGFALTRVACPTGEPSKIQPGLGYRLVKALAYECASVGAVHGLADPPLDGMAGSHTLQGCPASSFAVPKRRQTLLPSWQPVPLQGAS